MADWESSMTKRTVGREDTCGQSENTRYSRRVTEHKIRRVSLELLSLCFYYIIIEYCINLYMKSVFL